MCETMEKIKAKGIVEGEARGKRETMLATAKRLLANGKLMLQYYALCIVSI